MTVHELGCRLREMYDTPGTQKSTMIHLFGILYADQMQRAGCRPIDVVRSAQLPESYVTEVNKGIRLSRYVVLRDSYAGKF